MFIHIVYLPLQASKLYKEVHFKCWRNTKTSYGIATWNEQNKKIDFTSQTQNEIRYS